MNDERFRAAAMHWQRRIHTFAAYTLGDAGLAEEVTQDVLLRLWRHPEMLTSERLEAWLLRVARNACIDEVRRRRARLRLVDGSVDDDAVRLRPAPIADPERRVAAGELGRRLVDELAQLPETQRSAIILRDVHGLSYGEIAEVMDLSLATVRVSLHRGRRRLRERLEEVERHVAAV